MSRINNLIGFVLRAAIAGLALAFVIAYLWPKLQEPAAQPAAVEPAPPAPASYAAAINRAAPAVVSLYTRSLEHVDPVTGAPLPFGYLYRITADEGSGVIFSDDGYILTNHHVINQVSNIRVVLWDGRIIPARIVGSDPATDLAVLKVDLENLPVAPINEDHPVRVGDIVFAIGNALGLSHTVSMGIVSAMNRADSRIDLYQEFIQTDAAINAGNSGGALINSLGEVIGINTRNVEPTSGAQNIGFAIPISLARNVMDQIIEYGSVRRGWLGASFSDLRPTALPDGSFLRVGVSVRDVDRGGPAWDAGIRPGDVILTLDGETISDRNRLQLAISQRVPGTQIELEVRRGRETFETYATLIQQPPL
jgi:serine peptidase DegS